MRCHDCLKGGRGQRQTQLLSGDLEILVCLVMKYSGSVPVSPVFSDFASTVFCLQIRLRVYRGNSRVARMRIQNGAPNCAAFPDFCGPIFQDGGALLSRYCCSCTYLEAVFFSAVPGSEPESPGLRLISARHTSISGARACVLVCEQGSHLNPSHITRYQ